MGVVALLCLVSLALVGPRVWRASHEGRESLIEGSRAILRRDAAAARVEFEAARDVFASASSRLRSPLAWPMRVVPVASTHAGVARSLSRVGEGVAAAGVAVADTMEGLDEQGLVFSEGGVDLDEVRRAHAALRTASTSSAGIEGAIADMPQGWVIERLASGRRQAQSLVPPILDGVRKAEAALAGLPTILGEGSTKRYVVAFSNLSELRGSGGLFGFVTSLRARDGDLDLEAFSGRPTEVFPPPADVGLDFPDWFPPDLREQAGIFQNLNMTTDLPTAGAFVARTAAARLGQVDGVIAVDPVGISAILELVGGVTLPSWPRRITADNVARVAMHDVYVAIEDNDRREAFFGQLVRTAFAKLTSARISLSPASAGSFDRAARGGHFRMYSRDTADQSVFDRIGASGAVARARGATDVVSLVSENAAGNKADWYLRRVLRYDVDLDAEGTATGRLSATLSNTAPASGLPRYIIGSRIAGLGAGTNRQIVMLLRPRSDVLRRVTVDGDRPPLITQREAHLRAHRTSVDVAPGGRARLTATTEVDGAVRRRADGDGLVYRLHVLRQPVAHPDFAEIAIRPPAGWRAAGATTFSGPLTEDVVLEVKLSRTVRGSIVRTLLGPLLDLLD